MYTYTHTHTQLVLYNVSIYAIYYICTKYSGSGPNRIRAAQLGGDQYWSRIRTRPPFVRFTFICYCKLIT